MQLLPRHQLFVDRLVAACKMDERVAAVVLIGSYVQGTADVYSDLDLYVFTSEEAYKGFFAEREAFMQQLGELVFLEDFDISHIAFFIFADDVEGELQFGRVGDIHHLLKEPYQVLLDKGGALMVGEGPGFPVAKAKQTEALRRQLYWFWHEMSHLITALGRGQIWWAYGQLEVLRRCCVNLVRLQQDIGDTEANDEPYFKIEKAIPVELLSALQATICPLERSAILQTAFLLLHFYQARAPRLAQIHGIVYPVGLERVMVERLERLRGANPSE